MLDAWIIERKRQEEEERRRKSRRPHLRLPAPHPPATESHKRDEGEEERGYEVFDTTI